MKRKLPNERKTRVCVFECGEAGGREDSSFENH